MQSPSLRYNNKMTRERQLSPSPLALVASEIQFAVCMLQKCMYSAIIFKKNHAKCLFFRKKKQNIFFRLSVDLRSVGNLESSVVSVPLRGSVWRVTVQIWPILCWKWHNSLPPFKKNGGFYIITESTLYIALISVIHLTCSTKQILNEVFERSLVIRIYGYILD